MAEPSEAAEELLDAARYGDYADASAALDSGTPVNSADELGRTGKLKMIKLSPIRRQLVIMLQCIYA